MFKSFIDFWTIFAGFQANIGVFDRPTKQIDRSEILRNAWQENHYSTILKAAQKINAGHLYVSEKTGYRLNELLKMSIGEYYGIVAGIVYNNDKAVEAGKKQAEEAQRKAQNKRR